MKMSFKKLATASAAALILSVVSLPAAHAAALAPGGNVAPSVFAGISGTIVGDTTLLHFSSSTFSGTLEQIVLSGDATNPNGGLDFIYEVTNDSTSTDAIHTVSMT